MIAPVMVVRIEYCTVCWGYRNRALVLAEALPKRLDANVEVVDGKLGQFDVHVDGKLIWSRGDSIIDRMTPPRLPEVSEIIAAIERREPIGDRAGSNAHHEFGPDDAKRFYDRFGAWQDAQFYEKPALNYLGTHADFEHASAILELGCGTGRFAESLFSHHLPDNATYVGIDISTTMVGIAQRRLAKWSSRATVQQGDGTARLPFEDNRFDRLVATYLLDLLPQSSIHQVLSDAHRVLRPNGKLCIINSTEGSTPTTRIVASLWKHIYAVSPRLVGGCRPLRLSSFLEKDAWNIESTRSVCSWGICSEIVIASPA
jgi:selT/selW/selH-like putative selenoprotein